MGIGNTTAASAIVAAVTEAPVRDVTGRGTGIDAAAWERKVAVIERALARHRPRPDDPLDVLSKVGGYEIGALVGVILGAAARRQAVVLDGFISGAAALLAASLCRQVRSYFIPAHASVEIGHRLILEHLELPPLLTLNLRLGEGTGAALAMQLLDSSVALMRGMATFDEAGVSGQSRPVSRLRRS
jgi:nicotinate-nucleotide--dimethylbenzimidazole phosphoribosyltransferase